MNPETLYNQSLDYLEGKGVQKDHEQAFKLTSQAAETGHQDAVMAMGSFYLNGCGIEKNIEKAKFWYKKAARQGSNKAMFTIGKIAYNEHKYLNAFKWFQVAIENKHSLSIFWLGKLYWHGWGVNKNKKKAMQFFTDAARKKVKEAKRALNWINKRIAQQKDSK